MIETRGQEANRRRANEQARGDTTGGAAAAAAAATGENGEDGDDEINLSGPTSEGGAAGVSEATLGAYREMASAAASVDSESAALYQLMILSCSLPLWSQPPYSLKFSSRRLLLLSSDDDDDNDNDDDEDANKNSNLSSLLLPHLGRLTPLLLRATFDPSPQTRLSMSTVWLTLTGGPSSARRIITDNLPSTIDSLCDSTTSTLWRAREGSCGALTSIIVGRSWAELGGGLSVTTPGEIEDVTSYVKGGDKYISKSGSSPGSSRSSQKIGAQKIGAAARLLRLWGVSVRLLDDTRESVRERGKELAKAVRGLTVRLADPSIVEEKAEVKGEAEEEGEDSCDDGACANAARTALTFLSTNGLSSLYCPEATSACVSALLGVVEVSNGAVIGESLLPEIVYSLGMSLSR